MPDLTGFPDFTTAVSSAGMTIYPAFGNGSYSVLPQQLDLAKNANGSPAFALTLAQQAGDFSSTADYAQLSFSLDANFPLGPALALLRNSDPKATVKPSAISGGFCRLYQTTTGVPVPADLLQPKALFQFTTSFAEWSQRMSLDAGEAVKGALQGQSSLLLGARVEIAVPGVGPRMAVYAQFEPANLLTALLAGTSNRSMAASDVLAFFSAPLANYPVTITAIPSGSEGALPQILTDRVIAAYGELTPSPGAADPAFILFKPVSEIDTATTRWDLSEPTLVMRPWVFSLDPIGSIRALNDPAVLAGVIQEITIPALTLGAYQVNVAANLPQSRTGIAAIGARLVTAPSAPETVLFTPPGDSGTVQLSTGIQQTPQYTVTCFSVIAAGQFVQQYESAPVSHSETWIELEPDDFPLTFTHILATPSLLSFATINGVLSYQTGTHQVQQSFTLQAVQGASAAMLEVTVAAPSNATNVTITLLAVPLDGSISISLSASASGTTQFDLTSFPGFGSHIITVQSSLATGAAPLFIEFLAELDLSNPQAVPSKIVLTADQPTASWGYVATSPFHPGYAFRVAAAPGATPLTWSALQPYDTVLTLTSEGALATIPPNAIPAAAPTSGPSPAGQVLTLTQ
jgi:hypothetical protein